jgi:hypothetical protein
MRRVAGIGLLALVGCNQIFGISPTREWDAGIDGDLAMPQVRLTWQIADVTAAGAPDPVLDHAAITPAPRLRMAPIDVALDDSVDQATYDGGAIAIPGSYVGTTWRLEYTLEDGVPHELQWKPDDLVGHVTVPLFGRLERAGWPVDGGYTVMPTNPPARYNALRVLTTGLWTEGRAQLDAPNIDFRYFNATSLSGDKGGPDPVRGDRALVVDYLVDGAGCQVAVGSAVLPSATLVSGARTPQPVVWNTQTKPTSSAITIIDAHTRLTNALRPLGPSGSYVGTLLLGLGASPLMPGLSSTPSTELLSGAATLPVPLMLTLLRCPFTPPFEVTPPDAARPALDGFPALLHLQMATTRTVAQLADLSLTSGIETVVITGEMQSDVEFSAAIPIRFELTNPAQTTFDLSGGPDRVAVGPGGGAFRFTFATESATAPADLRADHYDVVLHRIEGGALTVQRIYTVTSSSVRIDGVLETGNDYVFAVRSFRGHPNASRGDFATVTYPYGSAVVFTRTFRTVPDED